MNLRKINGTIYALNDAGDLVEISADDKGHVETAIHDPRLPFGSVHTESLHPVFQVDAVYGVNEYLNKVTTGHATFGTSSASVTGTDNLFTCSTGTTALSFSTLQSVQRLRYRAGQGIIGRYTALFSEPAANSILVAGFGTAESGIYFGYNGTSFGILYNTGGVREIQTLTVTTAASSANDVTITLNGNANTVAVTNAAGDTDLTAYEISQGTFDGWEAEQVGSTVVFLKSSAGDGGTVSFSAGSTGAAASFAETLAGQAATDTWIPQTSWNGDKLDGNGASGVTLDPQKGNVFQIEVQYLGFGGIVCKVETCASGNNPTFVTAHTIQFPNTSTSVSLSQPSFPFTMSAYSAGSTTDVSVSCASYAGFIEGVRRLNGPRFSYTGTIGTTTTQQPIGTIRNSYVYKSRANQTTIELLDLNFTARSGNNTYTTLYLYKNIPLTGTPVYGQYSTYSSSEVDTSASGVTFSGDTTDNHKLIWTASIMEQGYIDNHFLEEDLTLQPGETLTFAVACSSSTGFATVSLNTREDH